MFNFKKKEISEDAKLIIDILDKFLADNNTKKMYSPITDEYLLYDDNDQVTICLNDGEVTFSNHVYLYRKNFTLSFTDALKRKVKIQMGKEIQDLKKVLLQNEMTLLDKINGLQVNKQGRFNLKPNLA